jgi:hypothetical protein
MATGRLESRRMSGPVSGSWTRDEVSASGQVFEFRLWAALTEQSRGGLHVFLPLADRGVDALVHRLTDGVYVPVQAKCRSTLMDGEVHLVVWAESLVHDELVIVGGLIVDGGLGPTVLVIPAGDFKRLAALSSNDGRPIYSAEFGMRPRSDSHWLPWLVPSERLVERFGVPTVGVEVVPVEPRPEWRGDVGFLGESEVIRRLAEAGDLNLFRPFPDSETAEIAVLHLTSRRVIGLQVKTVGLDQARDHAAVNVYASSFRPSPTTYFVVLAWLRDQARFHEDCLLIPSVELLEFAHDDGYGHITFEFHPGSTAQGRLGSFRVQLTALRAAIEGLVSGQSHQ